MDPCDEWKGNFDAGFFLAIIPDIRYTNTMLRRNANGNKIFAAIPAMPTENELTEE